MRKLLPSAVLIAAVTPSVFFAAESATPPAKNVLFIYVDDLRPELSCFGRSKVKTPNIDRLAAQGMVFSRNYCQAPVCMPSRVSTMCGKHLNSTNQGHLRNLLPKGLPSLPEQFKRHGYDSISIGKVFHYDNDAPEAWTKRYEDTFVESQYFCEGWCSGYQLPQNRNALMSKRHADWPVVESAEAPESAYPDGLSAGKAVAELQAHAQTGKPFFMAVGFYRPHLPFVMPKKYWDLYKDEEIDLAPNQNFPKDAIGRNGWADLVHYGDPVINGLKSTRPDLTPETFPVLPEAKQRELIHGYWASVSFVDAQIGRILDSLKKHGLDDKTAIVLVGDNGWQLGEYRLWSKGCNYEESIRVPLLVAVPGVSPKARKTDALTESVDIYPTLCDWAGLPTPPHVEGISLLPLFNDPAQPWKKAAFSVWNSSRSMRTDRYRLTEYDRPAPKGSLGQLPGSSRYELYDYSTTPAAAVNLAADPEHKPLLDTLLQQMNAGWRAAKPQQSGTGK
jgi:arylsulfatase A-like enzyme